MTEAEALKAGYHASKEGTSIVADSGPNAEPGVAHE